MSEPFRYKLFNIYTQQYITTNPQDSNSVLIEEIKNSLLEKILPETARDKLSVATIEIGMTAEMIKNNHPDSQNNTLLLAKGSRGIYGPPEYKKLLEPYLDLVQDYPYQRYLSNENVSLHDKKLKIWVVDDERGRSGIEGIDSQIAANILGDSHGKMSLALATEIGSPENLMQYRMVSSDPSRAWFAKGTLAPSLSNTLAKFGLRDRPELANIDLIVPTSSLKGVSKQNLTPGVHEQQVYLSHHERSRETDFTLRSVAEKLDGDSLASAIKQQGIEIDKLNEIFATPEALNAEFLKYLQPATMPDPDNPDLRIDFDPERWEQCGDDRYICFRKDLEGHRQIINSPVFARDKAKFYASRARKAAQLSFVKAKGGMIFCSSELANNQICVPNLPDGAKIAAIRSPIIKLQDIALVENKLIDDIKNDAGEIIKGAIVCSPQTYESLLFQTKNFIKTQTELLEEAEVNTKELETLNPWQSEGYSNAVLSQIEGAEREVLAAQLNQWREVYNKLVVDNQTESPQLAQIRQDTFTAIIKGDFDGDNVAILTQQQYPAIYAGIERRIAQADSYTAKLDKIEVTGERELGELLADKANPYILGKTANLAENLQSLTIAAERVRQIGNEAQQLAHLKKIAPSFYYMLANPNAAEIKAAEAKKVLSTFRYYNISSTGERLVNSQLAERFDAYGLDKALLEIHNGGTVEPIVRERLFATWKDLLLDLTNTVAQQNQIAVDRFKSERPVDRDLVEGLTRRFRPLNDGLKKVLKDKETYLTKIPKLNNSLTNRSLLVNNVTSKLISYQARVTNYKQIEDLFPAVEDEFVRQQVASISNEYDKLTSLASKIRAKAQIENGPALSFYDSEGRAFEVVNIISSEGHTVESLKNELKSGETNIRIEPKDTDKPHQFRALYSAGGNWKPLGMLCNACAQRLELDGKSSFNLAEVNGFNFISNSAVHLADSYSQQAYRLVADWRSQIPPEQVDIYAAATYRHLTKSTSQANRLGLMFKAFGSQMAAQLENLQLKQIKVDNLTGVTPTGKIEVSFKPDEELPGKTAVMQQTTAGEVRLGTISYTSHHFAAGTTAQVQAEFIPPSIGNITLESGEQLTVGGMNKSIFATAGEVFNDEELEMEVAPGPDLSVPILKVGDRTIGTLSQASAAYLEDAQLLETDRVFNLSLTSVGKGKWQKIKAVTDNGKVLEVVRLHQDFQAARTNELVQATVAFHSSRNIDQLFIYRQGKRMAVGEFNYYSTGTHRKSLQHLKDVDLYKKTFRARLNSQVKAMNLTVDPASVVYPEGSRQEPSNVKIEALEINSDTDYFLQQQQKYSNFGVIRERDFITQSGEIERAVALDIAIDKETIESAQIPDSLVDFQHVPDGNLDIENEVKKGFVVLSLPLANLGTTNSDLLKERFNLARIYDLSGGDLATVRSYQECLTDNYPNLVKFEGNMPGMERLFLPQLPTEIKEKSLPALSHNLLAAIELKNVLPNKEWSKHLNLDYFDYAWLVQTLDLDSDLNRKDIVVRAFVGKNLSWLKNATADLLTSDGELIYQHIKGRSDARFAKELESTFGKARYDFYTAKAKSLIEEDIVATVIDRNGEAKTPAKLITKRPAGIIPLPETIDKNLAAPIVIGGGTELGLALNNPADHLNPDVAHPINFDGQIYPSVQHAYSEIVNRDGVPQRQTYALVKNLMVAKLAQYPELVAEIEARGSYKWLYNCSHTLEGNNFWSGHSKDSPLIGILSFGLKQAKARVESQPKTNSKKVITLKSGQKKQIQNLSKATTLPSSLNIKGKPISMNFDLMLGDRPNPLPVDNCFEAMRGHGRSHTTRNFEPFKAYNLQEGDLAIAYRGAKNNPTGRVVIRIGKQYQLNSRMLNDAEFQNKWASREKHAPETLPKLFAKEIERGKEVWGMTFEPVGDLVEGKILDFVTGKELEEFKSTVEQKQVQQTDISKSIQHIGTLDKSTQSAILEHLNNMKVELNQDVSQYAKGRENFWLGTQWNLKDKQFEPSGTWNSKLWELCKNVYPEADIALITYSGDETSAGINLHRDDSYAAFEARSISIETIPEQTTKWQMQQTYPAMGWVEKQNSNAPLIDFELPSGSIIAFNCKNPHAAAPGKGRWSINLWKISDKQRVNYETHLKTNGIDGKAEDLGVKGTDIPVLNPIELTSADRASLSAPPLLQSQSESEIQIKANVAKEKQAVNPLGNIQPKNKQVAHHMKKDLAMADLATQFIGIPVDPTQESSTEKYRLAWGELANTGLYNQRDIVMVSGNGPWRADLNKLRANFETHYVPLLNMAIAGKAQILVGSAQGTDMMVQEYLQEKGYQLTDSGRGYVNLSSTQIAQSQRPQLNSDQLTAKAGLLKFLNDDTGSQFATLAGAAGTGKTFLVRQILADYKQQNPRAVVAFTAPTHAAVRVLEKMSQSANIKPDFEGTIYKLLQIKPSVDDRTGKQTFIREKERYAGEKIQPDLIVLDESSMVGKNLYHFLQEAIAANTKVLFMGDKIQLPPVNEEISPVFTDPAIEVQFELKKIMRYDGDLITTNDRLRQSVENIMAASNLSDIQPYLNGFKLDSSSDGQIQTMKGSNWEAATIDMFTSKEFEKNRNYVKAVAYRNVRVNELNQKIRAAIHGGDVPEYVTGDSIITTAPSPIQNSFETLLNSTSLEVKQATLMRDATTGYEVWQLAYGTSINKQTETNSIVVVADSSLPQYKRDLQQKWQEALKKPKGSDSRKQAFRRYYEHKRLFASVDYNYAITAHRAQGSTYQNIAVDHNDLRVRLNHAIQAKDFTEAKQALKEYYQLLYVAGTRAQSSVLVADDSISLNLQPISIREAPPVTTIQKNNIVAMISLPNLDRSSSSFDSAQKQLESSKQSQLKQSINEVLNVVQSKSRLLDSLKVWTNKSGEQKNSNSLIANFGDLPDEETLKYRAALIGRETAQKAVMTFREDTNGNDTLCSVNVANHIDVYELRCKLKELDIANFTLIPTAKFTKVVISDRGGELLPAVTELAKTYDTQIKITQGHSHTIHERDYNRTIAQFETENRRFSRVGDRDRPDQQGRKQSTLDGNLSRNRRIGSSPKKIEPALKRAIVPKIESPATVHEKLTLEAIPILRQLLENTHNRQFTDGQIVASYDSQTKTISLVDIEKSQVKCAATHDGEKWRSNPQYLGGMKVDDIAFLKAALVIARSKPTVKAEAKASTQSSFVEYLEDTEQQQSDIYQQPAVER